MHDTEFQWTIRGLYHRLFCTFWVILVVLLIFSVFIAYKISWNETLTLLNNPYNFSLLGACILCYLLDKFCANKKTISFKNNTLYYATQKRGIIYELPVTKINRLNIRRIGRNNHALLILMAQEEIKVTLTWTWVWNKWKLESYIRQIRQRYNIPE